MSRVGSSRQPHDVIPAEQDPVQWRRCPLGVAPNPYPAGVVDTLHVLVLRHRRRVLVLVIAVPAGLAVAGLAWQPAAGWIGGLLLATAVVAVALFVLAWKQSRPAALVVDPGGRSFGVPASPSMVYLTVFSSCATSQSVLISSSSTEWWWSLFAACCSAFVAAVWLAAAWAGDGPRLRPEGIEVRMGVGSLRVPWEALSRDQPQRPGLHDTYLRLSYDRPQLVRRRGIYAAGDRLQIDSVHPWFIADVIRHYGNHPEHRHAIGTPAEYHRLLHELNQPTPLALGAPGHDCPPE